MGGRRERIHADPAGLVRAVLIVRYEVVGVRRPAREDRLEYAYRRWRADLELPRLVKVIMGEAHIRERRLKVRPIEFDRIRRSGRRREEKA